MIHRYSAKELHDHFIKGSLSASEIVSHFLSRIDKYDNKVGAFLSVFHERVMAKAKALDEKRSQNKKLGKLAGVPIALKDNIHVKGELTTCASKFLTNYRAPFDATLTRYLEEEDALIIGKTNLDEFAMGSSCENSALKVTRNPWNLDRVPGGSSGGSCAAVAARFAPIAFGSDTGGSVRLPAAFCGLFGFKPTYGRVSRYGLVAFGSSLDQIGPVAATAEDIGMVMEVVGRHDPRDATSLRGHPDDYLNALSISMKNKKVGVPLSFLGNLPQESRQIFDNSLKELQALGCELVEVDLTILKYSIATYYIIATAEASTNLARFDGVRFGVRSSRATTIDQIYDFSKQEGFGPEVKRRILLGTYVLSAGFQDAYYKRASKVRVKMMESFDKAFELCDLIAMPMSTRAAFPMGAIHDPLEMYLQDVFTIGANLACLPAVSVPCGFTQEKLPMGLQLVGARREDLAIIRMAHHFAQKTGFYKATAEAFEK